MGRVPMVIQNPDDRLNKEAIVWRGTVEISWLE